MSYRETSINKSVVSILKKDLSQASLGPLDINRPHKKFPKLLNPTYQ